MWIYLCFPALIQISLKNSFGKVLYLKKKNWSGFADLCLSVAYTGTVQISSKIPFGKQFVEGTVHWTLLYTNGNQKYLLHLSVKQQI